MKATGSQRGQLSHKSTLPHLSDCCNLQKAASREPTARGLVTWLTRPLAVCQFNYNLSSSVGCLQWPSFLHFTDLHASQDKQQHKAKTEHKQVQLRCLSLCSPQTSTQFCWPLPAQNLLGLCKVSPISHVLLLRSAKELLQLAQPGSSSYSWLTCWISFYCLLHPFSVASQFVLWPPSYTHLWQYSSHINYSNYIIILWLY